MGRPPAGWPVIRALVLALLVEVCAATVFITVVGVAGLVEDRREQARRRRWEAWCAHPSVTGRPVGPEDDPGWRVDA